MHSLLFLLQNKTWSYVYQQCEKNLNQHSRKKTLEWEKRLAPLAIVHSCPLPPPLSSYPLWVLFAPFVGFSLPRVGPFAAFCGLFTTVLMGGSPLMWVVTVCVCVLGFFSLDLCGFLVHGEIFSSCGCSVGNGLGDSSHLERFLATPLAI